MQNLPPVLDEARKHVGPMLRAAVDELSPELRLIIDYHMGWRDREGNPAERRGSKSVRPALALLAAQAAGADPTVAIPGAVAVELLNNWAFLIDDVMDGDQFRRQRETAWVVFGQGQAICAGTALLTLAAQKLLGGPEATREAATRLIVDTAARMLAGQTLDMTFEHRLDVTVAESMTMTESKTASLMRCALSVGAVLAGGTDSTVTALGNFGHCVGVAFQARDDMLGIWGTPAQTGGRPPGFDLKARKGTPPIVVALCAGTSESAELRSILARDDLSEQAIAEAAALVDAAGGRTWTADLARRKVAEALAILDQLTLADDVRESLNSVAELGLPDDIQ